MVRLNYRLIKTLSESQFYFTGNLNQGYSFYTGHFSYKTSAHKFLSTTFYDTYKNPPTYVNLSLKILSVLISRMTSILTKCA